MFWLGCIYFINLVLSLRRYTAGRGVTANMLRLGRSDSGFESRRPDKTYGWG